MHQRANKIDINPENEQLATKQNNQEKVEEEEAGVATILDWCEEQRMIRILADDYNQYEARDKSRLKLIILGKLQTIIQEWIKICGRKNGEDEQTINKSGGKIFTFGSYKNKVSGPNSDIDTLVVAPRHIDRARDFFGELVPILLNTPEVTDLAEVREAYVPVIKMKFHGVDIDMLFARVESKQVGDDLKDLLDNNILRNCDNDSIRSLNGCRVTDLILKLVPNINNFEVVLRCIKLWSKQRGIHSNVMGYLGGVAWAILVAKVCKDNPKMGSNQLLDRFFSYYRDYEWGPQNPVTLCEIQSDLSVVTFEVDEKLLYTPSPQEVMPIITPAFPSMNSTFSVSRTTKNVLLTEIEKAAMITEELIKNKGNSQITWKRLFKAFPFFKAYEHFIEIWVLAKKDEDHKKWQGFAESKIKRLLRNLETFDQRRDIDCLEFRPYPKSYTLKNEQFPFNDAYYIGVRIRGGVLPKKQVIDLSDTRRIFYEKFKEMLEANLTVKQLILDKDIDLRIDYKSRDNLPPEVKPKISQIQQVTAPRQNLVNE